MPGPHFSGSSNIIAGIAGAVEQSSSPVIARRATTTLEGPNVGLGGVGGLPGILLRSDKAHGGVGGGVGAGLSAPQAVDLLTPVTHWEHDEDLKHDEYSESNPGQGGDEAMPISAYSNETELVLAAYRRYET